MKKYLLLTGAVLVLLATSLAVFRLQITSFVVVQALKRAEMTNIVFIPTTLNRHNLIVDHFACTLPGPGSRLVGNGLHINWSSSILHSRQLNTIFIDSLRLDLIQNTAQPPPVALQQRIAAIMGQLQKIHTFPLARLLPFQQLQVKKLLFTGKSVGSISDRQLSLELDKKKTGITARILVPHERLQLQAATTDFSKMVVTLRSLQHQTPLIRAEFILHNQEIHTQLNADLADLPLINPLLTTELPTISGKLSCSMTLSLQDHPHVDATMRLTGFNLNEIGLETGTINLHGLPDPTQGIVIQGEAFLHNTTLQQAGLRINSVHLFLHDALLTQKHRLQGTAGITATMKNVSLPQLHCDSITLPRIAVSWPGDKTIIVRLQTKQPLIGTGLKSKEYSLAGFRLLPSRNSSITASLGRDSSWALKPGRLQMVIDAIHLPELVITPAPLSINLQQFEKTANTWHLQTTITCPKIQLHTEKTETAITDIALMLRGDTDKINGNGTWKLYRVPGLFNVRFSHDLKTGTGDAAIATTKPVLFSQDIPLSAAVSGWSLPADLTGGKMQVKSFLRWPPLRMNVRLSLNKGKGFFRDIHFSGLSTNQNLQVLPVLRSRKVGSLTVATVDAGVPIHDFSTAIQLNPSGTSLPVVLLKNSRALLLGGSVSNDYIQIDPRKPDVRATIYVNDIHLADLLTLQQVKGLKVTGSVSGALPVRLNKKGFYIDSGRLHNEQAGGIITYTPPQDNGLRNSPLTGYALKALEEFHYNLLTASASYSPDGTLDVTLHLEGKSPKLDSKRPVHLNITTQQNLLSLLKSLRYSDSLTHEIDKEVQQHYHKKSSP